jgi:hypothetical protein
MSETILVNIEVMKQKFRLKLLEYPPEERKLLAEGLIPLIYEMQNNLKEIQQLIPAIQIDVDETDSLIEIINETIGQ